MSEDSPKIVNLETSLGLSEFLSEGEFPSEAESPSEERPSPGVVSLAQSTAAAGSGPVLSAGVHIEPTPFPSAPLETVASRPIGSSQVVADEHENATVGQGLIVRHGQSIFLFVGWAESARPTASNATSHKYPLLHARCKGPENTDGDRNGRAARLADMPA